jgi:hypothetical protein
LGHGVFGFKVDALGATTDLVFPAMEVDRNSAGGGDGLVLTEWKKAETPADSSRKSGETREQTDLHRSGALAGVEFAGYRFLIVVSKGPIKIPADLDIDGVVYRHMNIDVEPPTPSVSAKARTEHSRNQNRGNP